VSRLLFFLLPFLVAVGFILEGGKGDVWERGCCHLGFCFGYMLVCQSVSLSLLLSVWPIAHTMFLMLGAETCAGVDVAVEAGTIFVFGGFFSIRIIPTN